MSALFQQLPYSLLLPGHDMLYVLLSPGLSGKGREDRCQRLVLQIAVDLILVDVVVVAIATAEEQNGFPQNFSCANVNEASCFTRMNAFQFETLFLIQSDV